MNREMNYMLKLGLLKVSPYHLDIFIDYEIILMWDESTYSYKPMGKKTLEQIMNSTEFDCNLFLMLVKCFDVAAKNALEMCLS